MSRMMTLPKIGVNMTEAVIDEWLVKEGESISKGDVMLVAETDKATQDIFATDSGVIEKLLADVGDTVACGENIMSLVDGEPQLQEAAPKPVIAKADTITKAPEPVEKEAEVQAIAKAPERIVEKPKTPMKPAAKGDRVKISPLAKAMAKERGIDIAKLSPEMAGKRITKSDVEKFEKAPASVPAKQATAVAGTGSAYAAMEIKACADNMMLLIKRFGQSGLDIGYIDIITKALAVAISKHEGLFSGGGEINIGVEVDSPGGVIVPVVMGADKKTVGQIKADIDAGSVGNATFVVTNLGAFDIESYVPTRRLLGCATLCAGCVTSSFVPNESDMPKLISEIKMTLVFDDSATAGIDAAKFLQKIKQYIENPEMMLL